MTSKVIYNGDLRTKMTHEKSGVEVITDAPTDNHGLGMAFSPTDLVATGLASCMITIMGIKARDKGWIINGTVAEIIKIMGSGPRMIKEIQIQITMQHNQLEVHDQRMLEKAALTCPVALSLNPDIKQDISFIW